MTTMMFVSALASVQGEDVIRRATDVAQRLARPYPGGAVKCSLSRKDGVLSMPSIIGDGRLLLTEIANVGGVVGEGGGCESAACQLMVSGLVERFETVAEELRPEPRSLSPLRMILVLKKRPDISREQFIDYYEKRHAPLALRILPRYAEYARNYFRFPAGEDGARICADVVSEVGFRDQAHFDAFKAVLADKSIRDRIRMDEQHLFDPTFKWVAVVDEISETALRDRAQIEE